MHLTVIHPFGAYKRGDKISDPKAIKELLEGVKQPESDELRPHDNCRHVVKTAGEHEASLPSTPPEENQPAN